MKNRAPDLKHIAADGFINSIETRFREKLYGQDRFLEIVLPVIRRNFYFRNSSSVPIGSFFLAGPTGSGKSAAVETFAYALHRQREGRFPPLININCGEFQQDHEIAKLIGAPPGYLGHRETQPILTQTRFNGVMSEACNIAIILFDEVEKAAPSLHRLLLGVLGGSGLRLGDGTLVDFSRTLVFFTSNVGASLLEANRYGLQRGTKRETHTIDWTSIIRAKTSAEFVGRLTAIIPFNRLNRAACEKIVDRILEEVKFRAIEVSTTAGNCADFYNVEVQLTGPARSLLINTLQDDPTGARNLIRTLAHLVEEAYIGDYEVRKVTAEPSPLPGPPLIGVEDVRRILRITRGDRTKAAKG